MTENQTSKLRNQISQTKTTIDLQAEHAIQHNLDYVRNLVKGHRYTTADDYKSLRDEAIKKIKSLRLKVERLEEKLANRW